ncbi:VOC family protein [Brevibacterium renqingii]|uniref:VOC family protein n=1 Tax=Brevibacterium renqingii TaxID=2776916 RepID=UPI001ADF7A44|nr:VOC family protein [Brevibacterium renqingii]
MSEYPELLHTVIDTTVPRQSAEFYRQLLGYVYRPGDEPGADADAEGPNWLVLTDPHGRRKLAFQQVDRLEPTTWRKPDVPMQLHLDFTVTDTGELARQRRRAEELGAELILDRTDDEDEPLYVFTDLDGHPFCIFVA